MKPVLYWRYATRSLLRGGQRSLFAVFCVAVGVLVIVALQLVGIMVNAGLTGDIRALNGGDIAVHAESAGITAAQLGYFAQLQAAGTITAYSPVGVDDATTTTAAGLQRITFFTVDPGTFPLAGALPVITPSQGTLATLLHGNDVVVTTSLLQRLQLHIGDTLQLTTGSGRSGSVTVAGVIAATGVISGRADMLMTQQTYMGFRDLTGTPASYTWVFANVPGHSDATAAVVAAQLRHHYPLLTATTVPQTQQQVQAEIDGIRTFLRIIGLLALLIGGVGIINTMQVLLRRRLVEIAMLKTQGYRQRDLLAMFGLEALSLGVLGGVLGALLGIGLSFVVQALVERAFFLTLPTIIDPLTVIAGVGIGVATTLIFGLLPIVQTSAVRPLAVLRETGAGIAGTSRAGTVGLLLVLIALFFVLALSILGNPVITVTVVLGAGLVLGTMTAGFSLVAWLISRWPVPDRRRWGSLVTLVPILLIALLVLRFSPGFGALSLAIVMAGVVVACLPSAAKAEVQLAARNIGRARGRSATTLVALFVGVFAIGLGLLLGQNLKDFIASRNATVNKDNSYILASNQEAPSVAQQITRFTGVTNEQISQAFPDRLIAINGAPIAPAPSQGDTANISGVNGFSLATGSLPPATLEQGAQDDHPGRLLTTADAGSLNALFPLGESESPENLKLGDRITVGGLFGNATITLHVVGFYTGLGTFSGIAAVLVDQNVVATLSAGNAYTIFALHLPTTMQNHDLQQIKQVTPQVITLGDVATLNQIDALLDNIIQVVEAVASLAMLAGLILIANTVALAMLERRRELGILKAIGHTSRGVLGIVLVENGILGVVGAYVALLLVSLAAAVLSQLAFQSATAEGAAPTLVLTLVAATAALCMLVAGAVAWRATRVRPIEVLRYE